MIFLSRSDMNSIVQLVNKFPQFLPLYEEIAEFRRKPEEVISMFSETLYIMDRNMERLMVDELREEVEAKDRELVSKEQELASKNQEIEDLKAQLEALQSK